VRPLFDTKQEEKLKEILEEFAEGTSRILPALNFAQEVFGAITPDVESFLAERLDMPPARLREVLTFYHLYHKSEPGRYTITVCNSLSCNLLGSEDLLTHLEKRLGVEPGGTTEDGLFTLETSECIGACHQAPAFQVNRRFYGPMSLDEVDQLLDRLREEGRREHE
jgi:NADH-quinone oxidoreductase subunit E